MAIDQEIAQRVDAYRGNPQVLQQRYAANQELLDLLALQRLKSEKDDAMRKVQLEMQQDPRTIKQQKERQLLEMTKQDLTNQTAGIMQNTQKKQKKNMERVAKQGSVNPQQVQKIQAGLGALAQRQQQGQAPMRMAAGGIVAFQEAGLVKSYDDITQADINAYREKVRKTNIRAAMSISDDHIRKILSDQQRAFSRLLQQYSVPAHPQLRKNPAEIKTAESEEKPINARGEGPPKDPKDGLGLTGLIEKPKEGLDDEIESADVVNTLEETIYGAGTEEDSIVDDELVQKIIIPDGLDQKIIPPTVDTTGAVENERGRNILTEAGVVRQDPNAARIAARDDAATFLGRDTKRDRMDEYLKELKALDARQQDPKKLRRQERSAFLRGTAGGGSFGQTMAGGSNAMAKERARQEKSARDRLSNRINIDKSAMDMDMNIATSAQSSGDNAYAQAMEHQRTIASILADTSEGELANARANARAILDADHYNRQNVLEEARLIFDSEQTNTQNVLEKYRIDTQKEIAEIRDKGDRAMRAQEILKDLVFKRADFIKLLLANDKHVIAARIKALAPNATLQDERNLKKAMKAVYLAAADVFETTGLNAIEDSLTRIINGGDEDLTSYTDTINQFDPNTGGWGDLSVSPK